jgi:hypothetical protein
MCRGRERKQGRTRVPDEGRNGRTGPATGRGAAAGGPRRRGRGGGRAARRTSRIAGEACLSGCATCARLRYARLMSSSVASRPTAGEGERERERASGGGGCRCRCAGTTDAPIETEGRWSTHARGSRTDRARPPAPRPRPRGRPARPSRPRRAPATRVGVAKGGVVGNIIIIILRLRATARALGLIIVAPAAAGFGLRLGSFPSPRPLKTRARGARGPAGSRWSSRRESSRRTPGWMGTRSCRTR